MCASRPDELVGSPPRPLTSELLRAWPLPLNQDDDKHDRGTVLVVAGSERTPGAALLAGLGALRAGAGRVQIASTTSAAAPLSIAVPEALVQGLPATSAGAIDPEPAVDLLDVQAGQADAVLLGPGFDDPESSRTLVEGLSRLVSRDAVVILDALALRVLPTDALGALRARLVFTPNRQEAPSLIEGDTSGLRSGELAAVAARRHGATVALSGHVAAPDGRRWLARSGVPGLGTSGSGDVRAGLVAGVAARCSDAAQAACWGTYLHVTAGTRLAERVGAVGYLARELLDEVPRVMHEAMPTMPESGS